MKKFLNIILVIAVVLFGTAQTAGLAMAQATGPATGAAKTTVTGVVYPQSPVGGTINALVIDPVTPTTLYAGSNYGLYKSIDNGNNWFQTSLVSRTIFSIAVDPVNPLNIYVGTNGQGFFISRDGGATWAESAVIQNIVIYTIAVDPVNPANIYAGGPAIGSDGTGNITGGGGAFKSGDYGNSWISITSGLPEGWVYSILINPTIPSIVYAATYDQGVYKSFDGGASWGSRNTGLTTNLKVRTLAMNPQNPNNLLLGLWSGKFSMYETENGADGWQWAGKNVSGALINSLAINPVTPNLVYAGLNLRGPMTNSNSGVNSPWVFFPNQSQGIWGYFPTINAFVASPQNGGKTLFMGTTGAGIFRSLDGGTTWQEINQGLHATTVTAIAADPAHPNTLYASTNGNGVFKSLDRGITWSNYPWPRQWDIVQSVAVDAANPNIVYIASKIYGLGVSVDAGVSWDYFNANLPAAPVSAAAAAPGSALGPNSPTAFPSVTCIVVARTQPTEMLYVGTAAHGIYESLDLGASWKLVSDAGSQINSLQVFPTDPSRVLASSANQGVILVSNYGFTHANYASGLASYNVLSVMVDPAAPTNLYAGTPAGIYQSTNTGANWSLLNLSGAAIESMAIDSTGKFFAGSQYLGLFSSIDRGNWPKEDAVSSGSVAFLFSDTTSLFPLVFISIDGNGLTKIGTSIILNVFIKKQ